MIEAETTKSRSIFYNWLHYYFAKYECWPITRYFVADIADVPPDQLRAILQEIYG